MPDFLRFHYCWVKKKNKNETKGISLIGYSDSNSMEDEIGNSDKTIKNCRDLANPLEQKQCSPG